MLPASLLLLIGLSSPAATQHEPHQLCGAHCLYVALGAVEIPLPPFEEFRRQLGEPEPAGYSLGQLAEFADKQGAHTLGVSTNLDNLRRRPERFACIAHLSRGHYVLLSDLAGGAVKILDPPRTSHVAPEALATQWDGTALLVAAVPLMAEEDLPEDIPWWWWALGVGALCLAGAGAVLFWRSRVAAAA